MAPSSLSHQPVVPVFPLSKNRTNKETEYGSTIILYEKCRYWYLGTYVSYYLVRYLSYSHPFVVEGKFEYPTLYYTRINLNQQFPKNIHNHSDVMHFILVD